MSQPGPFATVPTESFEDLVATGVSGQPIELPIANGPATGFSWHLELPDGTQRIEDGSERSVDASVKLGAACGGPLRVIAPAGEHLIIAKLARPWAIDRPIRIARIRLYVT
jgi:predicted secreted protein